MKVQFYKDARGEWRWRLRSSNGRTMADSAEGYASRRNVKRAWRRVLQAVEEGFPNTGRELEEWLG